ncbi:MAG: Tfx family DNA-binding protein [Methanocalculus sp. MSAO_Arc1]|uniref:Tfx family DNA-binding protein n=1 Tax=Methanocalculus TaxID=71151 RepID=UPI000FECF192|nr:MULTISPECIES: Tfx family DNA-binding protein [unclassified Methanocalculus]MCP1662977.1 Tfx family DNA-binding protein [Methanocalculus sp. AMF5]RQD80746.1 MAG: Tfx family DNA-binding protein [Methanocalculus sp. MSAO_Arc1]
MKEDLLTERQKEVLRYRRQGMTQQQIADLIRTSKANVCTIEKSATENIRRARETLEFVNTLDAKELCTITAEEDLLDAVNTIYEEAERFGIKVRYDTVTLINRVKAANPEKIHARYIQDSIQVYINEKGDLFFE